MADASAKLTRIIKFYLEAEHRIFQLTKINRAAFNLAGLTDCSLIACKFSWKEEEEGEKIVHFSPLWPRDKVIACNAFKNRHHQSILNWFKLKFE